MSSAREPEPAQSSEVRIVPNSTENSFQEFPPYVPVVEAQWPEELWKAVREHKGVDEEVWAPLTEIGNDHSQPVH